MAGRGRVANAVSNGQPVQALAKPVMSNDLDSVAVSNGRTLDTAEASLLARTGKTHGLPAGAIADLLAGHYGVSARTVRRQAWWVPTMAGEIR